MDIKTVKHIASLARIKLTEAEEVKIGDDLSSILGYLEQLDKVNTEQVEPLFQVTGLVNSLRKDEPRKDFELSEDLNSKLIGQAPHKQERFLKVKSILNK